MQEITERQKEILTAIIKEFMQTACEVGSNLLVDKYDLDISSATIRNEMMHLMDLGLLEKTHISSGRIPTDQAIRMYVKDIMDKPFLTAEEEALIRQEIFRERFDQERLVKSILDILSDYSQAASFLTDTDFTFVRYRGISELMKYSELREVETMERVLDLLDNEDLLHEIVKDYYQDDVVLVIGRESGIEDLDSCVVAYSVLPFWNRSRLYFGVIGSRRIDYRKTFAVIDRIRKSVEESLRGWY